MMTAVADIAAAGTSVICTIHQPSTRIFALCTHLLLLQAGYVINYQSLQSLCYLILMLLLSGEVMYFGPIGDHCTDVLSYFARTFGVHCNPRTNPADFILEQSRVSGEGQTPAQKWRETTDAQKAIEVVIFLLSFFFFFCLLLFTSLL